MSAARHHLLAIALVTVLFGFGCGGAESPTGSDNDGSSSTAPDASSSQSDAANNPPSISRGSGLPSADPVSVSGSFPSSTGLFTVSGFGPTRPRDPADVVRIYRPNSNALLPLVLLFPGTGNTTEEILWAFGISSEGSPMDGIEPAIVIALPNANQPADWDHDSDGLYFNTTDDNPDTNPDLLLVRQAIKEAIRAYSIDPARVYAMGFSNGAFMASYVAMMLPKRLAGFAERSGGWARCLPGGLKAGEIFTSNSTDCGTILSAANSADYGCQGSTAEPFTALRSGTDRVPGYLSHDNQDSSVSVYYTCDLYQQMTLAGYAVSLDIRQLSPDSGGQHGVPEDFVGNAWRFLRAHSL